MKFMTELPAVLKDVSYDFFIISTVSTVSIVRRLPTCGCPHDNPSPTIYRRRNTCHSFPCKYPPSKETSMSYSAFLCRRLPQARPSVSWTAPNGRHTCSDNTLASPVRFLEITVSNAGYALPEYPDLVYDRPSGRWITGGCIQAPKLSRLSPNWRQQRLHNK